MDCGHVESLGAPGGAAGERGVAFKVDGEEAGGPVVAEAGEWVRVRIWIGLRQCAAVPEDETPVWGYGGVRVCWESLGRGDGRTFNVDCVS